jgi:hypothetical protein
MYSVLGNIDLARLNVMKHFCIELFCYRSGQELLVNSHGLLIHYRVIVVVYLHGLILVLFA